MPDLEALGDAATGAVIARAVEPKAGEADGHTHEKNCLNCGAPLAGPHCQKCGQHAHVHRTLGAFWHDLAHGVFHLDGKIWRTLPMLAWRPGELTRRYVDGERAKFVSPMALFLFSVFLMFATFSLVGGPIVTGSDKPAKPADAVAQRAEAETDFKKEQADSQQELKSLERERDQLVAARRSTAEVDGDIRRKEAEIALQQRLFRQTLDLIAADEERDKTLAKVGVITDEPTKAGPVRQTAEQADKGEAVIIAGADSLNAWFNSAYQKAKKNPSLLIYKLQTNAYKFSWLLIPISIPFVWLLFLHRRRYRQFTPYDHTVFVTYSIAFMSLAVIALSLLRPIGLPAAAAVLAMMLIPPVHIYRQLKGTYSLSKFSALWRTFILLIFASVAAGIFAALLLLLGVLD